MNINMKSALVLGLAAVLVVSIAGPVAAKPKGNMADPNEVIDACYRDSDCHMAVSDDGGIAGYTSHGGFGCVRLHDWKNDAGQNFYCSYSADEDDDEDDEEESE